MWDRLTPDEKAWVRAHPVAAMRFRADADQALAMAQRLYPDSVHNGQGDAFRHAYRSALMTNEEGAATAHAFANLHERFSDNPVLEMTMDMHNNAIGRQIAVTPSGGQSLEMQVANALNSGRLWWIEDGQLTNGR